MKPSLDLLLQRLQQTNDIAPLRQDARELLLSLAPQAQVAAEQALVWAGFAPNDLWQPGSFHLGLFEDHTIQLKSGLSPGHVICTLIEEHDFILGYLQELEILNRAIQTLHKVTSLELQALDDIATNLLNAEPHHQREEAVLFVAVEKRGMVGPAQVLRHDHEGIRARKQELYNLAQIGHQIPFAEFQTRMKATAGILILTLRDHIFKENTILYPAALNRIPEASTWEAMRIASNTISCCAFS